MRGLELAACFLPLLLQTARCAVLQHRQLGDDGTVPLKSIASHLIGSADEDPTTVSQVVVTVTVNGDVTTTVPPQSGPSASTAAAASGATALPISAISTITNSDGSTQTVSGAVTTIVTEVSTVTNSDGSVSTIAGVSTQTLAVTTLTTAVSTVTDADGDLSTISETITQTLPVDGSGATAGSPTASDTSNQTGADVIPTSTGNANGSTGSDSDSGSADSASSTSGGGSSGLSSGEIAAAVILPVLAVLVLLLFALRSKRLRTRISAWRAARIERSEYRRALDDPIMNIAAAEKGLGAGDVESLVPQQGRNRLRERLTFGLGAGAAAAPVLQEARRKPVRHPTTDVGVGEAGVIGVAGALIDSMHSRTNSQDSDVTAALGGHSRNRSQDSDAGADEQMPLARGRSETLESAVSAMSPSEEAGGRRSSVSAVGLRTQGSGSGFVRMYERMGAGTDGVARPTTS